MINVRVKRNYYTAKFYAARLGYSARARGQAVPNDVTISTTRSSVASWAEPNSHDLFFCGRAPPNSVASTTKFISAAVT